MVGVMPELTLRNEANFGPVLAGVVDEQLPLEAVRLLTRSGRRTTLLDDDAVVVVTREDELSLPLVIVVVDDVAAFIFRASAAARLLVRSTGAAMVARVCD